MELLVNFIEEIPTWYLWVYLFIFIYSGFIIIRLTNSFIEEEDRIEKDRIEKFGEE